jgi:hypothetical protein
MNPPDQPQDDMAASALPPRPKRLAGADTTRHSWPRTCPGHRTARLPGRLGFRSDLRGWRAKPGATVLAARREMLEGMHAKVRAALPVALERLEASASQRSRTMRRSQSGRPLGSGTSSAGSGSNGTRGAGLRHSSRLRHEQGPEVYAVARNIQGRLAKLEAGRKSGIGEVLFVLGSGEKRTRRSKGGSIG